VHAARSVRIVRARATPAAPTQPPPPPSGRGAPERRANRAATRRAIRLSALYSVGIAAVYALLVGIARSGPTGGSAGGSEDLLAAGLLAVVLGVVGVVVSLGAAPRAVELSDRKTIVVGRFGRRYAFPGRDQLRTVVVQRFPAGLLSPIPLESLEFLGGSSRRTFLLDEGLLQRRDP